MDSNTLDGLMDLWTLKFVMDLPLYIYIYAVLLKSLQDDIWDMQENTLLIKSINKNIP
jgi:hypothetical protein